MINETRLSELVALKLCHDLAGPIGALNNGVELLEDNNSDYFKDSFNLVQTTAKDAVSKLLLYRQAYSLAGKSIVVSTKEIIDLTDNLINKKKINLIYDKKQESFNINSYISKIILNVIILFEKYLILGGNLELNFIDENNVEVIASGENLKIQKNHIDIINSYSEGTEIDVSDINAYLPFCLAKQIDSKAYITSSESEIRFTVG